MSAPDEARDSSAVQQVPTLLSVVDYIRPDVADLRFIVNDNEIPWWVKHLDVPPDWSVGRYTGTDAERPWRISASGPQSDGGWDACETLTLFGYTGFIPDVVLMRHAASALFVLDGLDITTRFLITPSADGLQAARSTGYVTAAGLLIWTQCSYYVTGSTSPGQGRLMEQSLMVEASSLHQFDSAIYELGESALQAFVNANVNQ